MKPTGVTENEIANRCLRVGSQVNYRELLQSDVNGNQGKFCEMLRDQHLNEIQQYVQMLSAAFHHHAGNAPAANANANAGDVSGTATAPAAPALPSHITCNTLSLSKFREAILDVDPEKKRLEVDQYLARGAKCDVKEIASLEQQNLTCRIDHFSANLVNSGLVKRSGATVSPSFAATGAKNTQDHGW